MSNNQHVFWLALITVVSAEVGCFFRTAALVEKYGSPMWVCLGTLLGNAIWLIPIFLGGRWMHEHISPLLARILAGTVLMGMGLLILLGKEL